MKHSYNLILLLLMQPSFCFGTKPNNLTYSVCSFLNDALGTGYHTLGKVLWKYTDEPLSEKHTLLARSVAQEISIEQTIQFYKLPASQAKIGPHCVGNHIYLDEGDFTYFAHNRHALRFVIAHEMIHIEKFHHLKKMALTFTACGVALYLLKRLSRTSPFKEKIDALQNKIDQAQNSASAHAPPLETPLKAISSSIIGMILGLATVKIIELALRPLSRSFEREADLTAIYQLSKNNQSEEVKAGATEYLSSFSQKKFSWWKKLISTHPPIVERLAYIQSFNA